MQSPRPCGKNCTRQSKTYQNSTAYPKIHKKEVPFDPLVSSFRSIMDEAPKYLTEEICLPVGKTEHRIKNSIDFVWEIKDLEVPAPQKLVTFDVMALFNSISTDEAIWVIRQRLNQEHSWHYRTNLNQDTAPWIMLEHHLFHVQGRRFQRK